MSSVFSKETLCPPHCVWPRLPRSGVSVTLMPGLFNPDRHPTGNSWPPPLIALRVWLQQLLSWRGLLVKLQVEQLMSGSLRDIWAQTKGASHKQGFRCRSYFQPCAWYSWKFLTAPDAAEAAASRSGRRCWEVRRSANVFSGSVCFCPPGGLKVFSLEYLHVSIQSDSFFSTVMQWTFLLGQTVTPASFCWTLESELHCETEPPWILARLELVPRLRQYRPIYA